MRNDTIRLHRLPHSGAPRARVLFVTNMWPDQTRPYYGSFIASQAWSLAHADMAVDVVYVRGYLGVHSYVRALGAIPRVAAREPYDVIHVHYGHTAAASLAVRQRPLVISFCGADLLGAPGENGITRKTMVEAAIFRQVARTATVTITKSEEMERALPAALQRRNYVLPNGVDLDQFAPGDRQAARADLGWAGDEKVMLFIGNPDEERKNVGLARAAGELVRERMPSARLHIGWEIPPSDVPRLMNAADCLLFTSRSEGSPNVIKEAMACELPIVATPVGDIPERLVGVPNCYVRDPSPTRFAQAALQALEGGRAPGARAAVKALSIGSTADRLAEIYEAATAIHRRRATKPRSDFAG